MSEAESNTLTFKFACPICGQHLSATPDQTGMEAQCPTCSATFAVPAPPIMRVPVGLDRFFPARQLVWLSVSLLVVACGVAAFTIRRSHSGSHAIRHEEQVSSEINPDALKGWEVMKPDADNVTNSQGRLTPEARKRMRELLALQIKSAESQAPSLVVELTGSDHDVLSFRGGSVNASTVTNFLNLLQENDGDFWNTVRLASFTEMDFSGDGFNRVISQAEIIHRSHGYEAFLQAFARSNSSVPSVEDDKSGLSKAAKRTARQNVVLALSGGFKAQNQQLALFLEGNEEDKLVFFLKEMNEGLADNILGGFKNAKTANFWNSLRMLSFEELVFRGDHFWKSIPRSEFILWCRDYENYASAFRKLHDETKKAADSEPSAH